MNGDVLILCGGAAMVASSFVLLWPRKRRRASPENNWRQRDGSEMFGVSEIEPTISAAAIGAAAMTDGFSGSGH